MQRLLLLLLLLPTSIFSQEEKTVNLDTTFNKGWITLANDWRYNVGDNQEWAKPDFDDSSWKPISGEYLRNPDSDDEKRNTRVVWFRRRLNFDPAENQQLVMRIIQKGASEIYLDGKLIHKLGRVS